MVSKDIKKKIIELIYLILGTAITAISTGLFMLPNKLSTGGFSGIGTIIHYLTGLPIGTAVLFLNIPLFAILLLKSGKEFFLKAVMGTFFLAIFLNIFQSLKPITEDKFLACIYGGVISGIGSAITLKANGTTGGTELLSYLIKEFNSKYRISTLIVTIDVIVVSLNVIFFKRIEIGLYSAIAIFLSGKMVDIFFEGIDFAKMILIISPKTEEISERIQNTIKRGTTSIYAKGMYKGEDKYMLMCIASRNEIRNIRQIVKDIDPKAFIIITNAREVFGEGFKK